MINFRLFLKTLLLLAILLSFSCSTKSEIFRDDDEALTSKDIIQSRDLTQYEQGGHFWCHTKPIGNEDRTDGEKKVRDFIWKHWTEKKLGYIKLSCAGGADVSDTNHYFIEPNKNGEWNIIHRQISQLNDKFFRRDDILNSVERIENKSSNDWTLISKTSGGEIKVQLPL